MKYVAASLIGRFGNQMFQYAFAKAYCERHGYELLTPLWVGQKVFQIDNARTIVSWPKRNEENLKDGEDRIELESYFQNQKSLIYSRADCRRWFKLRPEIQQALTRLDYPKVVAHRRVGDYKGLGWPVVSEESYRKAAEQFGYKIDWILTEENPLHHDLFAPELSFVPDFFAMLQADVIFRGNSTFSWWGATLSNARVFSPVMDGIKGGEQLVPFVEGNHPRCLELAFLTDLHLRES